MKKIKFWRLTAAIFTAIALCLSCTPNLNPGDNDNNGNNNNDNDNDNNEVTEVKLEDLKENTLTIGDTERALTAIFVNEYSGYLVVTATDAEGAESFDWIIDNNAEYVQLLVIPSLYNKEFDVMTESEVFSIFSTYKDAPLADGAGPGATDGLKSGKCRMNFDGTNAEMFASIVLADSTTVSFRGKGILEGEKPTENSITRNDDTKPLRATFYSIEDGMGMFYFTPADIQYFEEIDLASYYVCIMVDESAIDGSEIDINDPDAKYVGIYYVDNAMEESSVIEPGATEGAAGKFSISRTNDSESSFNATFDVKFSENLSISFEFTGEMTDMWAVPEKKNEFEYNGETSEISSVVVDCSAEPWVIWLSAKDNVSTVEDMASANPIKITAPSEAFSGEPVGFSTYKETLSFEYDGNVWNFENGSMGTLTATLEGTILTVDFTNYEGFKGYFNGECIIIE